MKKSQDRVIEQRSENVDVIPVSDLLGKNVNEHCTVCSRSILDSGERSELFHITARQPESCNRNYINIKSFCEHCKPPHAIDVDVMTKSGGSTPRDVYIYYEIDTVFIHESEVEA